jgi:hypothetical protein
MIALLPKVVPDEVLSKVPRHSVSHSFMTLMPLARTGLFNDGLGSRPCRVSADFFSDSEPRVKQSMLIPLFAFWKTNS